MRTLWAAFAIVLAGLVGLLVLEGDDPPSRPVAKAASVATIASRVEVLRDLRFGSRPVPQSVSPAQARREGLEDLDRSYPEARRRADEEVLKLLGLIEPRVDLRAISASVFGEGVAGYYDPRSKRLRIVSGTTPDALSEMVLAHELTHALEDQRFGLALSEGESDDAALARLALVEGTATLVMQQYLLRYIGAEKALSGALASAFQAGPDLPKFLQDQLIWPYVGGMQFAQALLAKGGGTWKLVDLADRVRVPDSTEQVLHPEKWVAVEAPAAGTSGGAAARRLAPCDERDLGRVADERVAGRERRSGGRRVGRGSLRALAEGRRELRLCAAVPRRRRPRHALALGYPA